MICLVYGPSASGKSAWAEERICGLARGGPLAYFATMRREGGEAQARIERHLAQRAGKGFVTHETPTLATIDDAQADAGACVLLDDIGNLVANEMFGTAAHGSDWASAPEELAESVTSAMGRLAKRTRSLVVVADAVGEAGWRGGEPTLSWIACCGAACCKLAEIADEMVEVRHGIASKVKSVGATGPHCIYDALRHEPD